MPFEKPPADDRPDVYIKRDVGGAYEIVSDEPVSHDEVTEPGVFPTQGDKFLPVLEVRGDGSTREGKSYIAFYADVQRQLAEIGADVGDRVRIRITGKENGSWTATVEWLNSPAE